MNSLKMFFVVCAILIYGQPSYGSDEREQTKKCVALTFDDGPDKLLTPKLLSILRHENVRATFYLVGSRVAHASDIVREMKRDGHEIGNHSWSHPDFTRISVSEIHRQIEMTDRAIASVTGEVPRTIRPPYGAVNSRVLGAISPRQIVLWDVDTHDWRYRVRAWITRAAGTNIRSGSVILMHDIHPTSIAAVPGIIAGLRKSGYSFVTVSELSVESHSFCEKLKTR